MWRNFLLVILVLSSTVSAAAPETALTSNNRFWSSFRTAVLVNDRKALLSMTKFPFEVRGLSDSDPIKFYNKKDFPTVFNRILAQTEYVPEGGKLLPKTVLGVIYSKSKLNKGDIDTPYFFRVSQLVFEKVDGKWLCTVGYLEE